MATPRQPKAPVYPKTIGACIDLLYTLREQRLSVQRDLDAAKEKEAALETHIIEAFSKDELDGARGKLATGGLKRSTVYNIVDWESFIAYVAKKKAWELLQKRLATTAVRERYDAGTGVPGTEAFQKISLSLTKVGG